jgi:hypothetical protein
MFQTSFAWQEILSFVSVVFEFQNIQNFKLLKCFPNVLVDENLMIFNGS